MLVICWAGFMCSNSNDTRNFTITDVESPTAGNRGPAHTADVSARSDPATEVSRLSGFTAISLLHRDVAAKFTRSIVPTSFPLTAFPSTQSLQFPDPEFPIR